MTGLEVSQLHRLIKTLLYTPTDCSTARVLQFPCLRHKPAVYVKLDTASVADDEASKTTIHSRKSTFEWIRKKMGIEERTLTSIIRNNPEVYNRAGREAGIIHAAQLSVAQTFSVQQRLGLSFRGIRDMRLLIKELDIPLKLAPDNQLRKERITLRLDAKIYERVNMEGSSGPIECCVYTANMWDGIARDADRLVADGRYISFPFPCLGADYAIYMTVMLSNDFGQGTDKSTFHLLHAVNACSLVHQTPYCVVQSQMRQDRTKKISGSYANFAMQHCSINWSMV